MINKTSNADLDLNSDADLLNRFCCHRDEAAFAELVRRHGSMVLGVCNQALRHRQDAQDAFQATFLVLATKATAIKRESSLASWLYKVAYRTAMRAAKSRNNAHCEVVPEDVPIVDDPLTAIHIQSLQLALHEELSQMPATYQGAVILCYFEGKTRRQAAEELKCSDASVKAKLTRAKQMLRARLSRRGIAMSVAFTSCSAGMTATAQAAPADLLATTVGGCTASLGSSSFAFPTSVTNLVSQGSTMTSIPTTAKYLACACLAGIAFLGITWSTNLSTAQDAVPIQVIQVRVADAQESGHNTIVVDQPEDSDSTHLVSDAQDFSFYMGVQRANDAKSEKRQAKIDYAEKKSAAYSMLRDAELQRAELAADAPTKLEAQARAKLHEAEVDKLASKIAALKSKMTPENSFRLGVGTSLEPVPCCRENNLAYGRSITSSSQEEINNNLAQLAVDGDLSTRWCADDETVGQWIQVDLGAPRDVSKIRIHWEMMETRYSYKIETSMDGDTWTQFVDTSEDPQTAHMPEHDLNAKATRFIRITFLGNSDGFWSSIREIEVTDGELSKPPVEAWEKVRDDASGFEIVDLSLLFEA